MTVLPTRSPEPPERRCDMFFVTNLAIAVAAGVKGAVAAVADAPRFIRWYRRATTA